MRAASHFRCQALATVLGLGSLAPVARADDTLQASAEWRTVATGRQAAGQGPLAAATDWNAALAHPGADTLSTELEWRGQWRGLAANGLLHHETAPGGATESLARLNELQLSGDAGDWQWSLGKKLVGWDVGYAFRPNDLVAQAPRRTLLDTTPEGRPLLQLERFFGADAALSLVWVNPQHVGDAPDAQRGADEAALATRAYWRQSAADLHGFARWGAHTGTSVGAAVAWVVSDAIELHASARWQQRHDGLILAEGTGSAPVSANPWQVRTLGGGHQALVGATWTGDSHQSLLLEAWHDATAPSQAQWRDWQARNQALAALLARPGLPDTVRDGVAGNLAWQTTPMGGSSLRRDNLFVRWSWQPEPWQLSLDALLTPADRGRVLTAGLQWQGDQWRLNAAWRQAGGPADALFAQLPVRRSVLLAATRAF